MDKPSVTQILKGSGLIDMSMVRQDILERAQQFGSATHKACELADIGRLNPASVDTTIVPYLNQWYKFTSDYGITFGSTSYIEHRLESKKGFTGKPDRVVMIGKDYVVIDIKTSTQIYPSTAIQLAGYEILAIENGIKVKRRLCVQLTDTMYKVEEYKDKSDKSVFLSALNLYNFKKRKGLLK